MGRGRVPDTGGRPTVVTSAGARLRLPTLEIFSAMSGGALSARARPLTAREIQLAREVFVDAIQYPPVRVVVSWIANAPTTLGNYIRQSPEHEADGLRDAVLIHELTHVWQYQTRGTAYISDSLCHQVIGALTSGSRNAAYELTGEEIVEAGSIYNLTAEKQAMLVQLWYSNAVRPFPAGQSSSSVIRPQTFRDHEVCNRMIEEVRRARPAPWSYVLEEAAWGPGMGTKRFQEPGDTRATDIVPLLRIEF